MSEHECTEHLLDEIERLREANCELREGELKQRIRELEAVINDPAALWTNWLRGTVKLPSGIGDVRQYQDRIQRLEEALEECDLAFTKFRPEHESRYGDAWEKVRDALNRPNPFKPYWPEENQ